MRASIVVAIAWLVAGCGPGAYACEAASQCVDAAGVAGQCQANGWCSFPDAACGSGQRYGEHVGDGLAGDCVDPDGGSGSGSGSGTTAGSIATSATTLDGGVEASSGGGSSGAVDEGTGASITTTDPGTSSATTTATTSASTTLTTTTATTDAAMCGDGVTEADEQCDGADLGGVSCESSGYAGGALACAADCSGFDFSGCLGCGGPDGSCMPFGQCGQAQPCTDGYTCIAIGNPVGTCMPPCDPGCADGTTCNESFNTCGIPCADDASCPRGMACQMLLNNEFACMW